MEPARECQVLREWMPVYIENMWLKAPICGRISWFWGKFATRLISGTHGVIPSIAGGLKGIDTHIRASTDFSALACCESARIPIVPEIPICLVSVFLVR